MITPKTMPVRKIKANYFSLTGNFSSLKQNKLIQFESNLEQDLLFLLDFDDDVKSFKSQPIKIHDKHKNGKTFSYVPDFQVRFSKKSSLVPKSKKGIVLYEVKYRSDLKENWSKLIPKIKAARKYCLEKKWSYRLITDIELKNELLKNIKFLDHMKRGCMEMEEEYRELFLRYINKMKKGTVDDLLTACFSTNLKKAESLSVFWRMVCAKEVGIDLRLPLNLNSLFWAMQ